VPPCGQLGRRHGHPSLGIEAPLTAALVLKRKRPEVCGGGKKPRRWLTRVGARRVRQATYAMSVDEAPASCSRQPRASVRSRKWGARGRRVRNAGMERLFSIFPYLRCGRLRDEHRPRDGESVLSLSSDGSHRSCGRSWTDDVVEIVTAI